jgi:hypothetical protein
VSKINFKIETKKKDFTISNDDNTNADGIKQGNSEAGTM